MEFINMRKLANEEFEKMKRQNQRKKEVAEAKKAESASATARRDSRPIGEMGRDELIEYLNTIGIKVEKKVDQLNEASRYLALRVNGGRLTLPSREFDAYPVPDKENLPSGGWYGWSEIVKTNSSSLNSSICIFTTTRSPREDYRMSWGKFGKNFTTAELINDSEAKLTCYEITADDKDENGIVKQTFLLEKLVEWINNSGSEDSAAGAQAAEEKTPESDRSNGGRRKKKRSKTRKKRKKKTRRGGKRKTRKRKSRRKRKRKTRRR